MVDLSQPRGFLHLGVARLPAAVANVVADGIVEQHGVLRHHADGLAQRLLRHLRDILVIDQDAAAGQIIEAEQQPRDRRLAGAGGPDHCHCLASGYLEADAFEDTAFRLIGEGNVLEADCATCDLERASAGYIHDFRLAREDRKHALDVGHRLLDLAIDHAHEIERLVKLDHHGVDQHEIADRLGAGSDFIGAQHHGGGEPDGKDHRLPGIEHAERGIGLDAGIFVARHGAVVALRLALLGVEIFHRLVIEQRVDRLDVGVIVAVVHLATDADAPFGRMISVDHIHQDGDQDHHDVAPIELPHQHGGYERHFDDGRHQLQDHHAHDGLDRVAAALEHTRQSASLALEVEAQRQLVHMHEGAVGEPAHRVHRHLGEHAVARLLEQRHQDAHAAIGNGHGDGHGNHPSEPIRGRRAAGTGKRIGRPFECEGNRDRRELGCQQQRHGAKHPQLQVAAVGWPDIGPQMDES